VSVGTPQEMRSFRTALTEVMETNPTKEAP
jgi:hypothetical protein